MEQIHSFIPQDAKDEKSRTVKICTRSSQVIITFLILIMLFLSVIYKNLQTSNLLQQYLISLTQKNETNVP